MTDSELTMLSFIQDGLNYSYIIEKVIDGKKLRDYFELSFSSIYFLTNILEKKNLVETYPSFGKKKVGKKAIKITESGAETLKKSFTDKFSAKPQLSHPFDYILYHCHHFTSQELKSGLNKYIKESERIYLYYFQKYEDKKNSGNLEIGEKLVLKHFIHRLKGEIEWAKETKIYLQSIKNLDEELEKQKRNISEYFKRLILD